MTANSPFRPQVLAGLAAALAALFAASLLLSGAGRQAAVGAKFGANSYSRSAVGYLGAYEWLRANGYRVTRREDPSVPMQGQNGVLLLVEPSDGLASGDMRDAWLGSKRTLLVLPKWRYDRDGDHDEWIGKADLSPPALVQSILYAAVGPGDVARIDQPRPFTKTLRAPDPKVEGSLQLIKNSKLKPLIANDDGVLLGELKQGGRTIWVLADPDPLENHGLGKGDNVAFLNAIIEGLAGGRSTPLAFDEISHGFRSAAPNLSNFVYAFPFNLILLHVLAGIALLLYAAMGRFGAPQQAPRRLASGKGELIGNAASLLDHAGHHAAILKRYVGMTLQDAARALRAPRQIGEGDLATWLDKAGEARGVAPISRLLLERVATLSPQNLSALLGAARIIQRWKKDIIHGPSRGLLDR